MSQAHPKPEAAACPLHPLFRSRLEPPRLRVPLCLALLNLGLVLQIFLLIGSSVILLPGYEVSLPELAGSSSEQRGSIADKLVISYTRERLIFFNDQRKSDWNDLENALIKAIGRGSGRAPVIIVRADKQIPYQDLIQIFAITRRHGAKVFLVTSKP